MQADYFGAYRHLKLSRDDKSKSESLAQRKSV
jgi:hypothetical protein